MKTFRIRVRLKKKDNFGKQMLDFVTDFKNVRPFQHVFPLFSARENGGKRIVWSKNRVSRRRRSFCWIFSPLRAKLPGRALQRPHKPN